MSDFTKEECEALYKCLAVVSSKIDHNNSSFRVGERVKIGDEIYYDCLMPQKQGQNQTGRVFSYLCPQLRFPYLVNGVQTSGGDTIISNSGTSPTSEGIRIANEELGYKLKKVTGESTLTKTQRGDFVLVDVLVGDNLNGRAWQRTLRKEGGGDAQFTFVNSIHKKHNVLYGADKGSYYQNIMQTLMANVSKIENEEFAVRLFGDKAIESSNLGSNDNPILARVLRANSKLNTKEWEVMVSEWGVSAKEAATQQEGSRGKRSEIPARVFAPVKAT